MNIRITFSGVMLTLALIIGILNFAWTSYLYHFEIVPWCADVDGWFDLQMELNKKLSGGFEKVVKKVLELEEEIETMEKSSRPPSTDYTFDGPMTLTPAPHLDMTLIPCHEKA